MSAIAGLKIRRDSSRPDNKKTPFAGVFLALRTYMASPVRCSQVALLYPGCSGRPRLGAPSIPLAQVRPAWWLCSIPLTQVRPKVRFVQKLDRSTRLKILHSCINLPQIVPYLVIFLQNYIFFSYLSPFQAIKGKIPALLQHSDHDLGAVTQILHFCSFTAAFPSRSMRQGIISGQLAASGQVCRFPLPP